MIAQGIIISFVGALALIFGLMIFKFKIGYTVRGIDLKEYDNDKVSNISGIHTIIGGLCLIIIGIIILLNVGKNLGLLIGTSMTIIVVGLSLSCDMKIKKHARLR